MSNTIGEFIEGLQIIYADDINEKYAIRGEHDIIYVGGEHIQPDSRNGRKLIKFGFFFVDDQWVYNT